MQPVQPVEIIYPAPESPTDTRHQDLLEILQTALDRTRARYGPYVLHASHEVMNEARALYSLESGTDVNIVWSSTSIDKERRLLPIRIPLRKGLLGFRIALIPKSLQASMDRVKTAEDLKKLTFGQGTGWGDVALYEANGISVTTANYENLFKMLNGGHIDLFPRGLGEVFNEYDAHIKEAPNIAIEQHLLIEYPWPFYCFFNKKDAPLAKRVEEGIQAMIQDGSFDAIFSKYNAAVIKRANLSARRIIHINNPMLPKETPLQEKRFWYNFAQNR